MTESGSNVKYLSLDEYAQDGKTFIVAEVAQAHDGSVGILHSFIDAVATTGADAIKFQVHIADAESSMHEPFRTRFSYVDSSRYDYWKRMELSEQQWKEICDHCQDVGLEFMATPFSNMAVDLLEKTGVHRYKIGSGDICNPLLLEKISTTGKEVILSTGLGTIEDIDRAVEMLKKRSVPTAILQCSTKYPTDAEDIELSMIPFMRDRYNCPVGLSDHSGTIYAGLGAVALGATMIEVHVTFDKRMFGPDSIASINIDELKMLVEGIHCINSALPSKLGKVLTDDIEHLRLVFGKSLAVNRDLPAGHILTFGDLEGKKPVGYGISVSEINGVIGRKLLADKQQWDFLLEDDLL